MSEEELLRLTDQIKVLEQENRALRQLEQMDLKVELRRSIDKMQTAVLQFDGILQKLGGTNERGAKGIEGQADTVQSDAKDRVFKGRQTQGVNTRPL